MSADIEFFKSPMDKAVEFIRYTVSPYLVACVYRFPTPDRMQRFIEKYAQQGIESHMPKGYRILVCCHGNIDDLKSEPIATSLLTEEQHNILEFIKTRYEEVRISKNKKHFERYAEREN